VSHRSHKKSDAEFRKELINADMGVFNKITKRQTATCKYKAEKKPAVTAAMDKSPSACLCARRELPGEIETGAVAAGSINRKNAPQRNLEVPALER
jgi:hypothetical protein